MFIDINYVFIYIKKRVTGTAIPVTLCQIILIGTFWQSDNDCASCTTETLLNPSKLKARSFFYVLMKHRKLLVTAVMPVTYCNIHQTAKNKSCHRWPTIGAHRWSSDSWHITIRKKNCSMFWWVCYRAFFGILGWFGICIWEYRGQKVDLAFLQ